MDSETAIDSADKAADCVALIISAPSRESSIAPASAVAHTVLFSVFLAIDAAMLAVMAAPPLMAAASAAAPTTAWADDVSEANTDKPPTRALSSPEVTEAAWMVARTGMAVSLVTLAPAPEAPSAPPLPPAMAKAPAPTPAVIEEVSLA